MDGVDLRRVKEQYLHLAQKYHPDASKDTSTDSISKFIAVKQAYDRLLELDKQSQG